MRNEKQNNNYEKPEVEVIKLDSKTSFITTSGENQQQQTVTIGPIGGESVTESEIEF